MKGSKKWKSFNWNSSRITAHDSIRANLYGYNSNGEKKFITSLNNGQINHIEINGLEDVFPEMKNYRDLEFEVNFKDSSDQSAPVFKHWQIMYDEVPEAAIIATENFYFPKDTVKQGEEIQLAVKIKNVSKIDIA